MIGESAAIKKTITRGIAAERGNKYEILIFALRGGGGSGHKASL